MNISGTSSLFGQVGLLLLMVWGAHHSKAEVYQAPANQVTVDTLKPLTPSDYGQWENLDDGNELSNNGQWLVYGIHRNNDNNDLRLHQLDKEKTIILPNGTSPAFSNDNVWLGYLINPSAEKKKRLEKEDKPIHTQFGLLNLSTGDSTTIKEVAAFAFSGDGLFVALEKFSPKDAKKQGKDVIVQNLKTGKKFTFGNVTHYAWQDEGSLLALTIETPDQTGNGVQLFNGRQESVKLLDSDEAYYSGLTWKPKSSDLAMYRSQKQDDYEDSTQQILVWKNLDSNSPEAKVLDQTKIRTFPADTRIVGNEKLTWSDDGNLLYCYTHTWNRKPATTDSTSKEEAMKNDSLFEEAPALQIWHSTDAHIIPEQKQMAENEEAINHLAVWHLNANKFVQLGDTLTESTKFQKDVPLVLGMDESPYETEGMFGRHSFDVYTIDLQTGQKKKILDKIRFVYDLSPDGKSVVYFKDSEYHLYQLQTGRDTNVTENLSAFFGNEENDHPVPEPYPYGFIGWEKSGKSFLVQSKYDVWQLRADGSESINLTQGVQDKIMNYFLRLDPDEDNVDLNQPLVVYRIGEWSKKEGFSTVVPGKKLKTISWDDVHASRIHKAKDANVFVFVQESFEDSPDYFVGEIGSSKISQVSATNPFQKNYRWGKAELIEYTNANGKKLQGALYYPDDYQPGKKYPMITYIYELRSPYIHHYEVPAHNDYYNHRVFTSQGYFVLQPDIVFDAGDPGVSSTKTMEIAVKAVVDKGLVDANKVGLVGHSWGGYQTAFAVTRTNIFAAAVAGAGLTDLVSMYGMVAWAFGGSPENNHFEVGQERMQVPPWENLEGYARNSPVMNIDKMETPLMFEVGDADQNVDWRQGIEMYNAARRAGKEMVLLVYANEGHGLREDKNRYDYQNRILTWFGHYLKGNPAPVWMQEGIPYTEQQRQLKNWK